MLFTTVFGQALSSIQYPPFRRTCEKFIPGLKREYREADRSRPCQV